MNIIQQIHGQKFSFPGTAIKSRTSGFSSFTRKMYSSSRPKSLSVGRQKMFKSSSEPMNLQTEISPGILVLCRVGKAWLISCCIALQYGQCLCKTVQFKSPQPYFYMLTMFPQLCFTFLWTLLQLLVSI